MFINESLKSKYHVVAFKDESGRVIIESSRVPGIQGVYESEGALYRAVSVRVKDASVKILEPINE
jgi:hypothetical protein